MAKPEREKPSGEEETLRILYEKQCEQAGYRFPMREEAAACLPAYARERVLRVLIDLCARQKDGARVRSLAASLAGGADCNLRNLDGETPLILAAREGRNDMTALLIENGADVNLTDNLQFSALHYATENGFTEIVEQLLMAGAEV